jgi:hypothetical protein
MKASGYKKQRTVRRIEDTGWKINMEESRKGDKERTGYRK